MKAKTKIEIANEYGVCTKTLNRWLKEAEIDIPRGLIPPYQQSIIYERLGKPPESTSDSCN